MRLEGLEALSNTSLFRVVVELIDRRYGGDPDTLLQICQELRRRQLIVTEDYLLRYAADIVCQEP